MQQNAVLLKSSLAAGSALLNVALLNRTCKARNPHTRKRQKRIPKKGKIEEKSPFTKANYLRGSTKPSFWGYRQTRICKGITWNLCLNEKGSDWNKDMNKKVSLGTAITLMAIAAALAVAITMVYSIRTFNDKLYNIKEREATYEKLSQIDKIVRSEYYGNIDEKYLMDSIARGYIQGISDRYALYLTADQYQQQLENVEGKKVGIGVDTVCDTSGYMLVTEVYPESAAEIAGISVGDLILQVGDLEVTAQTYAEAEEALEGEAGTKITITLRQGSEDQDPIELTRRKIEIPSVYMEIVDNIAYIQITEFADATANQFSRAIENAFRGNVEGLIFDVRGNPGGTIDSVSQVLDRLLPAGDIVSATYKNGETKVLATSDEREVDLPMVVVVNEKTASAAELFAQSLWDYKKGQVVGVTTYGKGLMQTIYRLDDGSALDITVAKYNPPKSPNFDGIGVVPDYEVKLTSDQMQLLAEGNLDRESDPQMRKAKELINSAILVKNGGNTNKQETQEDSSSQESSAAS